MTSERIVSVLSNQWFKVKEIVDIMGIKDPLDIIYLKSKLKGLYRKGKIEYVYHLNDIYWKLNKEEFTIQDNLSLDFYREMVDKDPFDIDAWAELGFLYHEIIQNNEAIHCFEAVLNLDPFDAKSWMILGYYYNDLELIESSIECLENALRVFDYDLEIENFIVASINLAYLYVDQNDYNNSLNILYRLLDFKEELKPSELVGVYNIIARNFARKQEFIKTIAPIEKALEILPESKMTEETLEFIEIHAFNYQKEFGVSPFSKNIIF